MGISLHPALSQRDLTVPQLAGPTACWALRQIVTLVARAALLPVTLAELPGFLPRFQHAYLRGAPSPRQTRAIEFIALLNGGLPGFG